MTLTFVAHVGIGALFWVGIEYVKLCRLEHAYLRRPFEFISGVIPFLIILAIPLLFNMHKKKNTQGLVQARLDFAFEGAVLKHTVLHCPNDRGIPGVVALLLFNYPHF